MRNSPFAGSRSAQGVRRAGYYGAGAGKQVAITDIADLTSEQFQKPLPLTFSRCSG